MKFKQMTSVGSLALVMLSGLFASSGQAAYIVTLTQEGATSLPAEAEQSTQPIWCSLLRAYPSLTYRRKLGL